MKIKDKLRLAADMAREKGIGGIRNLAVYQYDLKTRPDKLHYSPLTAHLEVTTKCNLKCKMCEHSFDMLIKPDLDFSAFQKIIGELPYLKNLILQGLGEPLLNPDLFRMIAAAKQRGIRTGFTTNGTLLNPELSQKIIDSKLDWLYISLDALDKGIFEEIRRGAYFEITKSNIENFFKLKGKKNPETNFWTLLMKENINEIPKVIAFAEELGMEKVVIQSLHNWGHEHFAEEINKISDISKAEFENLVFEIKKVKRTVRVEINQPGHTQKCNWPWRALYISADGFATPCCMQGSDPAVINFGNLLEQGADKIINNEAYCSFRKDLRTGLPKVCRGCPAVYEQEVMVI
jgi:MoaA/NifB/PqqE/SkfB family radical SAM enzyme